MVPSVSASDAVTVSSGGAGSCHRPLSAPILVYRLASCRLPDVPRLMYRVVWLRQMSVVSSILRTRGVRVHVGGSALYWK